MICPDWENLENLSSFVNHTVCVIHEMTIMVVGVYLQYVTSPESVSNRFGRKKRIRLLEKNIFDQVSSDLLGIIFPFLTKQYSFFNVAEYSMY